MQSKNKDALTQMREQVEKQILQSHPTVERFCWDSGLNKATVSNFLRSKKDFRVSTLAKIAKALNRKLTIRLD